MCHLIGFTSVVKLQKDLYKYTDGIPHTSKSESCRTDVKSSTKIIEETSLIPSSLYSVFQKPFTQANGCHWKKSYYHKGFNNGEVSVQKQEKFMICILLQILYLYTIYPVSFIKRA